MKKGYKPADPNLYNLDIDDLSDTELRNIEDINTTEGCLDRLRKIVEASSSAEDTNLMGHECQWSSTGITESDIKMFETKALRFDDMELQDRNVDVLELERRGIREEDDEMGEREAREKDASRGGGKVGKIVLNELRLIEDRKEEANARALRRDAAGAGKRRRSLMSGSEPTGPIPGTVAGGVHPRKKRRRALIHHVSAVLPGPQEYGGTGCHAFSSFREFAASRVNGSRPGPRSKFVDSDLTLPFMSSSVSVTEPIARHLKDHQIEGIRFMWKNVCSDLIPGNTNSATAVTADVITNCGCILAHNMGLGKSIQAVALLHTLLTHPALVHSGARGEAGRRIVNRALLVVPVNTIANWKNEFNKWIGASAEKANREKGVPHVSFHCLNEVQTSDRGHLVSLWLRSGGVLCVSSSSFSSICKPALAEKTKDSADKGAGTAAATAFLRAFLDPGPDIIVLDEGHTMLKNSSTGIFKTLCAVRTRRRVVLTGTPIQNNLTEYYHMANWVSPNCLGSEYGFKHQIVDPIMAGMAKDSAKDAIKKHDVAMAELQRKLSSVVERKGASVLAGDLPFMQQVVLHVRQSKLQVKLYRAFKQKQKRSMTGNNFFDQYHNLRPVNNHPATLLFRRENSREDRNKPRLTSLQNDPPLLPDCNQNPVLSATTKDGGGICSSEYSGGVISPSRKGVNTREQDNEKSKSKTPDVNEKNNDEASADIINLLDSESDEDSDVVQPNKRQFSQPTSDANEVCVDTRETNGPQLKKKESSSCEEQRVKEDKKQEETITGKWWEKVFDKTHDVLSVKNGGKLVLLLEILAQADTIGEKVVVFSQCLKTLDYIEKVLNTPHWEAMVPSLCLLCQGRQWGPWRKNFEYLRIDGGVSATERGELVTSFNDQNDNGCPNSLTGGLGGFGDLNGNVENSKVFLISTLAGGIGINLVAANRVVLFDSHWNPAIDLQALYRCYRYGQEKPVFVYRLLTEGTMEEKVYSRSVNKSGLAARVIDQKNPERSFTTQELSNLLENDTWVQCDECEKWRMLPPFINIDEDDLPDTWFCEMNIFDKERSTHRAKERDAKWYAQFWEKKRIEMSKESEGLSVKDSLDTTMNGRESIDATQSDDALKNMKTERDEILKRLLHNGGVVSSFEKSSSEKSESNLLWISKYNFHECFLRDTCVSEEGVGDTCVSEEGAAASAEFTKENSKVSNIHEAIVRQPDHEKPQEDKDGDAIMSENHLKVTDKTASGKSSDDIASHIKAEEKDVYNKVYKIDSSDSESDIKIGEC